MKPVYRKLPNDWLFVAESALLLGVSKVSVYKALNCGRLEYRMIEGLQMHRAPRSESKVLGQ